MLDFGKFEWTREPERFAIHGDTVEITSLRAKMQHFLYLVD